MINPQLFQPKSIAVIGASNDQGKPGGKVVTNLIQGGFKGPIFVVNPKPLNIIGTAWFEHFENLPDVDLAILSIPAQFCLETVKGLLLKGAKAFIIYSAGFGEAGEEGKLKEIELLKLVNVAGATLIGPNCIGIINQYYKGVFTTPVPEFDPMGCEMISSSGATAVFIMEAALSTGLRFSNVYSIGNASQTGVEEILEHMDETFVMGKSPMVKLLYLENIRNPQKFLKHSSSLIGKGCKIAAIKSGHTISGSRAATSHTGAMATSDQSIRALFKKAGVVYCSGRKELISVACVFLSKPLKGKNLAIITHAGGSAVMLTDALTIRKMNVPPIDEKQAAQLLSKLNPGSSVSNPIDFLATGTAKQLGEIIDFCEELPDIDGMIVVFGSPGLFNVKDVYQLLDEKIATCKKPIYPVLPSLINAKNEIDFFLSKQHVNFPDEVVLGKALPHVYYSSIPTHGKKTEVTMDAVGIRNIIDQAKDGYLSNQETFDLLSIAGIPLAKEKVCFTISDFNEALHSVDFPIAIKVIGPLHKTEVGGVALHIVDKNVALETFDRMMNIPEAKGVQVQEMVEGMELFIGTVDQQQFGQLVMCGLGGVFVELLKDFAFGLAPLDIEDALHMIRSLKGYAVFKGYRNAEPISEEIFADAVMRISSLVTIAPEINELDINPLKAIGNKLVAVDARIKIAK